MDIAALQESDVLWDGLEMFGFLGTLTFYRPRVGGIRLTDLESFRCARWGHGTRIAEKAKNTVMVFQSRKPLRLVPPLEKFSSDWREERIGKHRAILRQTRGEEMDLYTLPRPRCLVFGSEEAIRSVLAGKRRGGVPSSGLLAFMAGPRSIASWSRALSPDAPKMQKRIPFRRDWFHKERLPCFIMFQIRAGKNASEVFFLLRLRFAKPGVEPEFFAASLRKGLKWLREDRQMACFVRGCEKILEGVEIKIEGQDVSASRTVDNYRSVAMLLNLLLFLPLYQAAFGDLELESIEGFEPFRWAECVKVVEEAEQRRKSGRGAGSGK